MQNFTCGDFVEVKIASELFTLYSTILKITYELFTLYSTILQPSTEHDAIFALKSTQVLYKAFANNLVVSVSRIES